MSYLTNSVVARTFKKWSDQEVGVVTCNVCNQCLWVLIINGCVRLGTDLFNHSKGLFFNRALNKFSECQYNMSFHVQNWPDISNGWSDIATK